MCFCGSASGVPDSGDSAAVGATPGGLQQSQQLLLSPAGLQLAQLQAQLGLQRLKLAQQGTAATGATVLNQVLSNVAMAHPLFSQLRTSAVVGNPQGAFPAGVLGFPGSAPAFGTLVGGGFNQSPGTGRLTQPGGGARVAPPGSDYGRKCGSSYPVDTDKRLQYDPAEGPAAALASAADGTFSAQPQAQNMSGAAFRGDFNGHEMAGQAPGFNVGEGGLNLFASAGPKEQWKDLSLCDKLDRVSKAAEVWAAAGPPFRPRTDLYNPEEPTPEPKFNSGSGQLFGRYQYLPGSGETLTLGTRTLQAAQVNDFHAVAPGQLPHMCSICNKKVYNLKVSALSAQRTQSPASDPEASGVGLSLQDWDQHVKGKLHLQNRTLYGNNEGWVV